MDRYRQIHFGFRIPMITLPIGCLFQLISLASPYWIKIKVSSLIQSVDIHLGLWRACFALNNAKPECSSDMSDNPDWFKATQACAILGLIFAVVAMVSLYLKNCSSFQNKALGLLAMVSAFAAVRHELFEVVKRQQNFPYPNVILKKRFCPRKLTGDSGESKLGNDCYAFYLTSVGEFGDDLKNALSVKSSSSSNKALSCTDEISGSQNDAIFNLAVKDSSSSK
ncbi:unnamed protein product [Mytilus edulis]|uniref:Uncharacterized protein n=1 Tax=Mytilus edulis TaxID=6550 RepID=A0A8S3R5D2_MYTED|nr:unnamed protein product [Mytilus edulis]